MTIKQHGGIFGRNPTFNDVNATDITTTNLDATDIDVTNIDTGTLHVATNLELTPASSTFGTAPAITYYTNGYVYMTGGPSGLILRDDGGAVGIQIQNDDYIKFETGNPAAEAARFNSSGNLAFPSGQGIDFSATSDASGSTSELFDDYEEGDFTPTYVASTTDYDSITYGYQLGKYVKIGRMVHCTIEIRTMGVTVGSGAGYIEIHGLPYANSSSGGTAACVRFGVATAFAGGSIESVRTRAGEAALSITDTANNSIAASNIGTGTYANQIHLTFAYQTA